LLGLLKGHSPGLAALPLVAPNSLASPLLPTLNFDIEGMVHISHGAELNHKPSQLRSPRREIEKSEKRKE